MSQAQQIKVSEKVQGIIEKSVDNKVINRKELHLKLFHIGVSTPSRKDLQKTIASLLRYPEEQVVIKEIRTSYGSGISDALVVAYSEKEIAEKFEPKYLLKRGNKAKKEGGEQNG
ncbi:MULTISPECIES: 30S ribosomal protein S24e [Acidianus]|uniref:Small ribosomal subunit protein eS24 n=1 Tax=Candidatus Acidianus copahuensis TaxID=1160895 RepID=A0A031LLP7_9CREN|nr:MULTISPECIES: 30S ribosomal protein S24e [Acidianus]EZQ03132.1 30S ribosomal protein S24 [Candidatus Acidianus copahuensis]NON63115.1 30S ribosomal protein S24e [Acidianus sp. RZ1]